ncbi:PREDICTED: neuropeptide FF receptor 2-like [Branchiostoma belcheri]|uniref:Neuropeptide FF receptor 1 n=1 Tax=Branchiostoma belcheri TaxID=7741 RepID=A0A6P5A0A0_BRABE|nr:PREDICTED: neuropeptide FF receptor 2-like [Branchiostoma belcheri]
MALRLKGLDFARENISGHLSYNGSYELQDLLPDNDYLKQTVPVVVLFVLFYVFNFCLCIVGNIMVCFVILKMPRMQTVTNFFLLNLAVSDLLVAVFCMPFTLVDNIIRGWPFGDVMCKLTPAVQVVSVAASVFTLVAIAVDRFYSVVHPTEPKFTIRGVQKIVIVVWSLALFIMVPQVLLIEDTTITLQVFKETLSLHICAETSQLWRKVYTVLLFTTCYVIPLVVIVLLYIRIGLKVWEKPIPGGQQAPTQVKQASWKRKVKVVKMLLAVVVLFAFSWLPLHTMSLLSDHGFLSPYQEDIVNVYIYPIAHWLSYFNSSVNPIIYGYYNENFRNAYKSMMCDSKNGFVPTPYTKTTSRSPALSNRTNISPQTRRSVNVEEVQLEVVVTHLVVDNHLAPPL